MEIGERRRFAPNVKRGTLNVKRRIEGMEEHTLSIRRGFEGKLLKVDVLDVALPGGGQSIREVVRHPGAVVVLGRLADGSFVLVRQFRKAVEQTLLEAVAGTMDPGESPDACARRELQEETGYTCGPLQTLGEIFPAPGYTEENLHLYFADLQDAPGATSPDEDEHVEVVRLTGDAIAAMIDDGQIRDAKTLAIWLLYERKILGKR